MSLAWFVILTMIGAAMVFALFFVIPGALISILRYELWSVRDQLFDQIHAGVYKDNEQPRRLLRFADITIEVFGDLTLANIGIAALLMRRATNLPADQFDLEAMAESDREKIRPLFSTLGGTMLKRIFFASWSGLLGLVVLSPVVLVSVGIRRLRPRRKPHVGPSPKEPSPMEEAKGEIRKRFPVEEIPVDVLARPNGHKTKVVLSSFH